MCICLGQGYISLYKYTIYNCIFDLVCVSSGQDRNSQQKEVCAETFTYDHRQLVNKLANLNL